MHNRTHQQAGTRASRRNDGSNGRVINRKALMRRRRALTMQAMGIQPASLRVGAANDKYEKEADKVAEHVVNSPGPVGGGVSQGAGGAQRGMDRTAGRNREVDHDEDANILTKRLQRGVKDATDDVTDDEKDVANKSPLQGMMARDASETQAQRTVDPEDPEGKINKKPIEISRMPGAKGDDDAMKMHDDSGYRAGEPTASEMGQRMPEEEAAPESDSEMMDGQPSRLQRMGEDDLQEKPMAQRDALKGYDDEAKMKPLAQRECATCGQEAKRTVQRREGKKARNGAFTASNNVSREVKAMKNSGGRPLPASERAYLEPRFGRDLSHVRLHTDDRAAKTSQAIDAKAFTVGNNIAFNKGYYRPGTHEGRKLLAHEITHTIQQTGGRTKGPGGKARGLNREIVQRLNYKVKQRDRLYRIARAHNMTVAEIYALNPQLGGRSLIHPGQELFLSRNIGAMRMVVETYKQRLKGGAAINPAAHNQIVNTAAAFQAGAIRDAQTAQQRALITRLANDYATKIRLLGGEQQNLDQGRRYVQTTRGGTIDLAHFRDFTARTNETIDHIEQDLARSRFAGRIILASQYATIFGGRLGENWAATVVEYDLNAYGVRRGMTIRDAPVKKAVEEIVRLHAFSTEIQHQAAWGMWAMGSGWSYEDLPSDVAGINAALLARELSNGATPTENQQRLALLRIFERLGHQGDVLADKPAAPNGQTQNRTTRPVGVQNPDSMFVPNITPGGVRMVYTGTIGANPESTRDITVEDNTNRRLAEGGRLGREVE